MTNFSWYEFFYNFSFVYRYFEIGNAAANDVRPIPFFWRVDHVAVFGFLFSDMIKLQ